MEVRNLYREPERREELAFGALEFHDVFKIFRSGPAETVALRGLELRIERRELVALFGPSGSGKSTALHLAAGLDAPSAGEVRTFGRSLSRLDESELADDVPRLERIVEVPPPVIDAGKTRTREELVAEHLLPESLDRRQLREETVAAEVEPIPVELDRLRQTADDAVGFEHDAGLAELREYVRCGEPAGACAQDRRSERGIPHGAQAPESTPA